MTQHYTRNTQKAAHYCSTCKRHTMHAVWDRRLGNCLEHGATGMSKKQEQAAREREAREEQSSLF